MESLKALNSSVRSILSSNAKLEKSPEGSPVLVAGLSLAPSFRSGVVNVCPHASAGCVKACVLWFAGRTVSDVVRNAAILRTKLWNFAPDVFYERLGNEISTLERKARKDGAQLYVRLNVASDINHPNFIFENHTGTVFYDYTKSVQKALSYGRGDLPRNYHVSYSISERTRFEDLKDIVGLGVNVVGIFSSRYNGSTKKFGVLPETARILSASGSAISLDCVDGDVHDIRTPRYDGKGRMIALRLKGTNEAKQHAISRGFAIRFLEGENVFFSGEYRQRGNVDIVLKRDASPIERFAE